MGRVAYPGITPNADAKGDSEPRGGASSIKEKNVDLIAYWQKYCAPYLRARFGSDEKGASLVEYALLVALIAVVCIGAVSFLGSNASKKFSTVGSSLQ
ncbi:MAG: pilus assembly protein Flp/PilA [Acidimicrobiaceae bacterium]|nr:pilus assembly protein Flp/PilA [Acidimicrobiaceae bacterium]